MTLFIPLDILIIYFEISSSKENILLTFIYKMNIVKSLGYNLNKINTRGCKIKMLTIKYYPNINGYTQHKSTSGKPAISLQKISRKLLLILTGNIIWQRIESMVTVTDALIIPQLIYLMQSVFQPKL